MGIDARAAAEEPAGGGRYVRELLRALAALPDAAGDRFVLHARERWDDPALDARFTWALDPKPDPVWNLVVGARAHRTCDVFLSTNSYLTAWVTRVPTACVVFDLIAFVRPELAQRRAGRIERATLPLAVRRAAALPCISTATRDDLVARFPRAAAKAHVVPLAAAPPPAGMQAARRERPYVLAVGTIEPRKNLVRLLDAWAAGGFGATHDLLLTGPAGWDDAAILERAREVGAQRTGHVPDAELLALYAGCDAFAYPALYEGFGLPVVEALAAGAPVLTSTTSSLPEVAGDAALLVDPADTTAITGGLRRLLGDEALRARLRAAGPAQAARFSWERTARETLSVLRAVA
ncbi:MAG TPA: glycosyltransferase family 1 protein [Baekduia sp.]|nr:glycosyltransferase family 1 protein [Baekduia sp.]